MSHDWFKRYCKEKGSVDNEVDFEKDTVLAK